MPLYEYRCQRCDREFEELLLSRDALVACPGCQSGEVERLLSVVSAAGSEKKSAPDAPCGRCGDVRGPGACAR